MADDQGSGVTISSDQFGRVIQVGDRFTKRHLAGVHGVTRYRNGVGADALHRDIHALADKAGRPLQHDH